MRGNASASSSAAQIAAAERVRSAGETRIAQLPNIPTLEETAKARWSDVLNQPKIEVYDTSASIALTSTPTLLTPASTAAGASGIVYDAATGVFTFSAAVACSKR